MTPKYFTWFPRISLWREWNNSLDYYYFVAAKYYFESLPPGRGGGVPLAPAPAVFCVPPQVYAWNSNFIAVQPISSFYPSLPVPCSLVTGMWNFRLDSCEFNPHTWQSKVAPGALSTAISCDPNRGWVVPTAPQVFGLAWVTLRSHSGCGWVKAWPL